MTINRFHIECLTVAGWVDGEWAVLGAVTDQAEEAAEKGKDWDQAA